MHVPVYIYIGQEYSESLVKRLDLDLVIINCLIEADTRQPGSALVKLSSTSTLAWMMDHAVFLCTFLDLVKFSLIRQGFQIMRTHGFRGKKYICAPNAS